MREIQELEALISRLNASEAEKLLKAMGSQAIQLPKPRGRVQAEVGESRDLVVSQDGNRITVELPVHTLGLKGGNRVAAFFQDDAIVVVRV